jgi:hypothetical protein
MGYIVPELLDLAGPGLQDKIVERRCIEVGVKGHQSLLAW